MGAHRHASGWNDGSRLATTEALVDYGTFAIDNSVFVDPSLANPEGGYPYASLMAEGTLDKIRIDGQFYSDKSPVPAVGMAAIYFVIQRITGVVAREQAAAFNYWMTVLTSGVSLALAVGAVFLLSVRLLKSWGRAVLVVASFTGATTALVYSRAVNIHVVLLACTAAVTLLWWRIAVRRGAADSELMALGVLTGAAYTADFGIGPHLLGASLGVVLLTMRRLRPAVAVCVGALPLVGLHHLLTYVIGGTLAPVSTVADYFAYPGSAFSAADLTGTWNHQTLGQAGWYGAELLFGGRGFLVHNPPLLLVIPAAIVLWRTRHSLPEAPAVCAAYAFLGSTWATYTALSTNLAGICVSIRWFVPWLAPAYLVILVLLRRCPGAWVPFILLSVMGAITTARVWDGGPWTLQVVPFSWLWMGAALTALLGWPAASSMAPRDTARRVTENQAD